MSEQDEFNSLPEQYRPLSPWAYFGYTILYSLPIIGIIMLIINSLSSSNINRRNFSRSFFCVYVIAIIVTVVIIILSVSGVIAVGAAAAASGAGA